MSMMTRKELDAAWQKHRGVLNPNGGTSHKRHCFEAGVVTALDHIMQGGAMRPGFCDNCGRTVHLGDCYRDIFSELHQCLDARERKGRATYGETIDESPLDGLREARDELLDAAIYLTKAIRQRGPR